MLELFRRRRPKVKTLKVRIGNFVFINENNKFELYKDEGLQIGFYAQTGAGKTYNASIISSQWPAGLWYDPTNAVKRNIARIGMTRAWKFYKLTDDKDDKKRITINANLITEQFVMKCFNTRSEEKIRSAFQKFLDLDFVDRTYENLETILRKSRLSHIFYYLKRFLAEDNDGLSLEYFYSNRICVDASDESSKDSLFLGVIIGSIMRNRQKRGDSLHDPYFFGIDEAQDHAERYSYNAKIFDLSVGQGRGINISSIFTCNGLSTMTKKTTNNIRVFFIGKINFPIREITTKIRIPLTDEDIESLPFDMDKDIRGYAYYYNTVVGHTQSRLLLPNTHFRKILKGDKDGNEDKED